MQHSEIPVTVLMSARNEELYLKKAVDSILCQTFPHFELLIIDDGSSDKTWQILNNYDDQRMRLLQNSEGLGLASSLNKGLALAYGKYIARMDADDIALPERLARQVTFLENHPHIGIVGCACQLIDRKGQSGGLWQMPETDLQIRWFSLLGSPFIHPGVTLRRNLLIKHALKYDEMLRAAQDYALWTRLLPHTEGANLAEPLLHYRVSNGITATRRSEQLQNQDRTSLRTIKEQLPNFAITLTQVSQLRSLFVGGEAFVEGQPLQRTELIHLYLDLLDGFCELHTENSKLVLVRHEAAAQVARVIPNHIGQSGSMRVAVRLISINPNLRSFFRARLLEKTGYYRLRSRAGQFLRRLGLR